MKRLIIAAAVLSMVSGAAASAQPRHDRDRDGIPNAYDRQPNRPNTGRAYGDRDRDGVPNVVDRRDNRFQYRGRAYDRFRGPAFVFPRGYAYRRFGVGEVLPGVFLSPTYTLNNWAAYHLARPARGLHYVRVGPDVLLVDRRGRVVEVIHSLFY